MISGTIFQSVPFGSIAGQSNTLSNHVIVDSQGYAAIAPILSSPLLVTVPDLSVTMSGQGSMNLLPVASANSFNLAAGSVVTLVVAPAGSVMPASDAAVPLVLVECADNGGTTDFLGSCEIPAP
jgi:hypothetical protein